MRNSDTLIIFDMGGVLIKLDFGIMFNGFSNASGLPPEKIREEFAKARLEIHRNIGDEKTYSDIVRRILNIPISDEEINDITQSSHPDSIGEMMQLKEQLHRAGYTIGILSVISPSTKRFVDEHWPDALETWGGPRELSCETKVLKPDPKAYERFVNSGAKRIIYIDDKAAYLNYPATLGWTCIQFTGFEDVNEPMRLLAGHVPPTEQVIIAKTPEDVKRILREKGLVF